ncbi:phage major capsid protein, P2 family [Yersinia kristensenii]|uniref:phage major capsid protein, P2 family n=1 Tax=Yersinia kristensenii TaxID=28152 RepID=UPI001C609443|nr:phage major capsid protein, P2 family [Yersinia kristensenii]
MMLTPNAARLTRQYIDELRKAFSDCEADTDNKSFTLSEPRSIALRKALMERLEFLGMITMLDVPHPQGQVVNIGESTLRTGRVKSGRFTKGSTFSGNTFQLVETDSCNVIPWETLAIWANAGSPQEFFNLMNSAALHNFGEDILRIGFNGINVSDTTDPNAHPNGEDANIGWHQIAKNWGDEDNNVSKILTDPITIGEGGDFIGLDAAASDLIRSAIPSSQQSNPNLVVLVGADLLAAEEVRLYNKEDRPSEQVAAQQLSKNIAGRKAYCPPFMPGKRMVVTTLQNLQVLTLKGSRRRKAEDVGDRKQFENSYWRYEGYALGNPELYAAIDETAVTIAARKTKTAQEHDTELA